MHKNKCETLISNNQELVNLNGLENLNYIGGYFAIKNNPSLIDISGLNNLSSIGTYLVIYNNPILTNLDGLENIYSIGEVLAIENNDALINIDGLMNLTSIGFRLTIENNDVLTSLSGLENIESASIENLHISDNAFLSKCDIQSICDYLASPNGIIEIHDNAPGCNSPEEVEAACDTVSVQEVYFEETFSISPNPSSGSVNLRFTIHDSQLTIIDLFEISGVRIKGLLNELRNPGSYEMEVDLSDLQAGVYFCVLKTREGIKTTKIVKL